MKKYEITGTVTYAHAFSFEIEAESKKQAREIADRRMDGEIDPSFAEFQSYTMDPIKEIEE